MKIHFKSNTKFYFLPILLLLIGSLYSCQKQPSPISLQQLIDHYGGNKYYNTVVSYSVDNFKYTINRDGQRAVLSLLEKNQKGDSLQSVLENGILRAYLNDSLIDKDVNNYLKKSHLYNFTYKNSIPFVLSANDIQIDSIGYTIKGTKPYQLIKAKTKFVEDIDINEYYLYINPTTKNIEYVSLRYVTESKTPKIIRFYNHRKINGLLFADYTQFIAKEDTIKTENLIEFFDAEHLTPLSDIKFENIEVVYKNL